ncbi:glycosyltransferase family 4 protein [Agrobacterium pusense]|uniref:glycosyltransferase family 4 protein n=1 Tax=Agrobacterium pusense TaxID=648995 RepID=UPI0010BE2E36|nr:glycosyltransferase family 4 protein [Agrobacterium pusense]MDH0115893.1 glycosyltransferase family 4 protein [Agrobacterium pusense]QCL87239.1 glycosyltransferase family 4 protein [Agrobacterium pusense]
MKKNKAAVLLCGAYGTSSGMGRTTLMFCNALLQADPNLTVVLGSNLNPSDALLLLEPIFHSRIEFRDLTWAQKQDSHGTTWVQPQTLAGEDYLDCNLWFLWNLPAEGIVSPLRPYVIFCADLLVRIVPSAYSSRPVGEGEVWQGLLNTLLSYRYAALVYCTTPRTLEDVVAFAGVPRTRVWLAPQFAPLPNEPTSDGKRVVPFDKYFLWTSNDTAHKNHIRAINVLDRYYNDNPTTALPLVITGVGTRWFNPDNTSSTHDYHIEVRELLQSKPHVLRNIFFPETLSRPDFIRTLRDATFLWHNVLYDNGTASVFEAAEYGVPSLVSDYPQMRFFDEKYNTGAVFFSAYDIESGAKALEEMTRLAAENRNRRVSIDYSDENRRFHEWIRNLLGATRAFKPNEIAEGNRKDLEFNTSEGAATLASCASKIWRPLGSYIRDLPWTDIPVVCLELETVTNKRCAEIISAFESALREHYRNFKLLILVRDDAGFQQYVKSILTERVLVFDFFYAGLIDNSIDRSTAHQLADVVFSTSEYFQSAEKKKIDLDECQTIAEITRSVLQNLPNVNLAHDLLNFPPPIGCRSDSAKSIAVSELTIPPIQYPPSEVDFSQKTEKIVFVKGFYDAEPGFCWVQKSASARLSGGPSLRKLWRRVTKFLPKNLAKKFKRDYLFIELEIEDLAFADQNARKDLFLVCSVNGESCGARKLEAGRNTFRLELESRHRLKATLNTLNFETNYEYKAGGATSPDQRLIAWKALKFGFVSE